MLSIAKTSLSFDVTEWHRLDAITTKYEPKMRHAYLKAMRSGKNLDKLHLRQVITSILVEVCDKSSDVYSIVFNPNSELYIETIDRLVDKYAGSVDSSLAREAVRNILPLGLSLPERKHRLNTFGLDAMSAVKIEQYRQQVGNGPSADRDVARVRADLVRQRGNLLALTETNRAVNVSLEALWLDNMVGRVHKRILYDTSVQDVSNIPDTARKVIVTRRDNNVCNYCKPLDNVGAPVGEQFDTKYGWFDSPPFHPRCKCQMVLFIPPRRSR